MVMKGYREYAPSSFVSPENLPEEVELDTEEQERLEEGFQQYT